jgi:hypothetical protein
MKSVAEMEAKGGTEFMRRIGNQVKKVRLHIIAVFSLVMKKVGHVIIRKLMSVQTLRENLFSYSSYRKWKKHTRNIFQVMLILPNKSQLIFRKCLNIPLS